MENKRKCPYCENLIGKNGIATHVKHKHSEHYEDFALNHVLRSRTVQKEYDPIKDKERICDFGCKKKAKYRLKNGKFCCSKSYNTCEVMKLKNGKGRRLRGEEHPRGFSNKIPHNKGKETPKHIRKKISNALKKSSKVTGKATTYEAEVKRRKKISQTMKGKSGGYRKGSGRGKQGWYKGYWCDSSWELAFVIYNLEHNVKFKRNYDRFEYEFDGEKHFYIPDFVMEDGLYAEIKGYEDKRTLAKYTGCKNLIVLKENDLKEVFDYVIRKYGKKYIELYEKNKGLGCD